jgi:surface carbohydrate biosynthesis protein
MSKIFLLPVETSVRELDYKLLLSLKLLQKKGRVFIGSKGHLSIFMKYFSNFNYIDKGYHSGVSEKIHSSVRSLGGEVFSLDEEGAVDFQNRASLSSRYSIGAFNKVKRVYFWGKNQENIFSKNKTKSIVTGHPRFELLGSKFKKIYSEEFEAISLKYGNFVLVNTNMGLGNNIRGDEFVINNYSSRFPEIQTIIYQDKKKIEEICQAIKSLLDNNYKVVLRPHPEEDLNIYKSFFANSKDLFIINEGSVVPWIMASDFLIHTDCTTAIEGIWLDKMCISIMPKNIDQNYICPLPINLSFSSHPESLMNDIAKFASLPIIDDCKIKLLEENFSFSSESLKLLSDDLICNAQSQGNIKIFSLLIHSLRNQLIGKIKKNEDKLITNKLRGFNQKNINYKLGLISNSLETKSNCYALKISKYLYEIKMNS